MPSRAQQPNAADAVPGVRRRRYGINRQPAVVEPDARTSSFWPALELLGIDPNPQLELGGHVTPGGPPPPPQTCATCYELNVETGKCERIANCEEDDNGNIMPGTYWYYHQDMPEGHYGDDINAYNELVEEQEWEDWTTSDGDGMQEVEDMLAAYYDTDWGGDYDSVGDIDFADMGDEEIHILEDGSGATMSHAGTEELKRLLTQIRDGSKQEKWVAARVLATIAMNKAGKRRPENWSADYADMDIYDEEYDNKDLSDSDRDLIQAWENDVQVLIDELLKSDGDNEWTDISELELSIEQQGELDQALIDYNDIINTTKQKQGETEESIVEAFNTIEA